MPKRKQKNTSTGQGKANLATPAPTFQLPPNPLMGLGQDARYLLIQRIDQEIGRLEQTAQELIAVRNGLIGVGIAQAQAAQPSVAGTIGVIKGTGLAQSAPPEQVPAKKRGRPPGSKNKPTQAPEAQAGEQAQSAQPAQPTQEEMFKEAVDATRPEMDEEFQKTS
jgi:hypothetical protein